MNKYEPMTWKQKFWFCSLSACVIFLLLIVSHIIYDHLKNSLNNTNKQREVYTTKCEIIDYHNGVYYFPCVPNFGLQFSEFKRNNKSEEIFQIIPLIGPYGTKGYWVIVTDNMVKL